jgi:hypothetical protein
MINEVEERNRKKKEERGKPAGKKKKSVPISQNKVS